MSGVILVSGATGMQGGAVIEALLRMKIPVRALTRRTTSPAARSLAASGATIVGGDFDDRGSLAKALEGAQGVFSVQLPPEPTDLQSEIRTGKALIAAALEAGVRTFVHTSVARAGDHEQFAGWAEGRWWKEYWTSKSAVNEAVRAAGFDSFTILKPAFMMDNFLSLNASLMFPALKTGCLLTALEPSTRLDLIAADDVGRFAAAALTNTALFNGKQIDLAAEALTMTEVALTLEQVKGKPVKAEHCDAARAVAAGMHAGVAQAFEWDNVEGYKVDISALSKYPIGLTSFADWAALHRDRIDVG